VLSLIVVIFSFVNISQEIYREKAESVLCQSRDWLWNDRWCVEWDS